jgi:hypothetical protein
MSEGAESQLPVEGVMGGLDDQPDDQSGGRDDDGDPLPGGRVGTLNRLLSSKSRGAETN